MKYTDLPDNARVWIYQSETEISPSAKAIISRKSASFLETWAAHGTPLKAAIEIFYDRFIVIFLDENHASATGCSIDKSVHFIKELEAELEINLMNRLIVTWLIDEQIFSGSYTDVHEMFNNGEIPKSSEFFNNLITTNSQFQNSWKVPYNETWMAKQLN